MNAINRDFHLLTTELGPVVFHSPSYRLFQVDEETSKRVSALKKPHGSYLPDEEVESLQITLLGQVDKQPFRLKTSLLGEYSQLNGFYLFVSQECNLACTYCYGDGGEYRKSKRNMDETTARNFVDKFLTGDSPTYSVNFFGGEPFLNFNLMQKVVDYAKEKGRERGFRVSFKVTTNGTVWSDRIKQFVDKEIDNLTVSLDGPKAINDAQRPPLGNYSSYEKTICTIEELKAIKDKRYTIRTILTKQSCEKIDEVYSHNSALVSPGGVGMTIVDVEDGNPLALSDDDYFQVRRSFKETSVDANDIAPVVGPGTCAAATVMSFPGCAKATCSNRRNATATPVNGFTSGYWLSLPKSWLTPSAKTGSCKTGRLSISKPAVRPKHGSEAVVKGRLG
jgi:uncharacterized protein